MNKNRNTEVSPPLEAHEESAIVQRWQSDVSQPKVSIICHTYNHAPYIDDAINGFLAQQTTFPFEVIIHDDASTDGTREILDKYQKNYPRLITLIAQDFNQWSQGKRPAATTFPCGDGEYIALCEGDDYWVDELKLARQVAAMSENPGVNLCIHPSAVTNLGTGQSWVLGDYGQDCIIKPVASAVGGAAGQFAPTSSYLFRTHEAKALPAWFFNDPRLPFGDLFIEAIIGRKGILYLPRTMSVYRKDVTGSHSAWLRVQSAAEMVADYENRARCLNRLRSYDEIPDSAIDNRLARIQANISIDLLKYGAYMEFLKTAPQNKYCLTLKEKVLIGLARTSWVGFAVAKMLSVAMQRCKCWHAK